MTEPEHYRNHKPIHSWAGAFLRIAIVGVIIWAWTQSDYSACQSVLVNAFDRSSCNTVSVAHIVGQVLTIGAGVLFIVAVAS